MIFWHKNSMPKHHYIFSIVLLNIIVLTNNVILDSYKSHYENQITLNILILKDKYMFI